MNSDVNAMSTTTESKKKNRRKNIIPAKFADAFTFAFNANILVAVSILFGNGFYDILYAVRIVLDVAVFHVASVAWANIAMAVDARH